MIRAGYLFSVRNYDVVNVFGGPELGQIILNSVFIEDVQEAPMRLAEQSRVVLNSVTLLGVSAAQEPAYRGPTYLLECR